MLTASANTVTVVSVVASATPHTKGAWTAVGGVTATRFDRLHLWVRDQVAVNLADTSTLLDIAFGPSGSEVVQIANLPVGHLQEGALHTLPLRVPAGTQIAMRTQSVVASKSIGFAVLGVGLTGYAEAATATKCVTYGADTATSNGTPLTAPASDHNKGSWTEIGTLTRPSRFLYPVLSIAAADTSTSTTNMLLDVGYGGAGSEVALVGDIPVSTGGGENIRQVLEPWPASLPTGTRIVGRIQKNNNSGVDISSLTILAFD
jgi:hypothetical protein